MDHKYVIRAKLMYDEEFLQLCIAKLYELQESDEQAAHSTRHDNGVGFTRGDSATLSEYAEIIAKGHRLNPIQLRDAHHRMLKYVNQLSGLLTAEEME